MRLVTYNVLADKYLEKYGHFYGHVKDRHLLNPGARLDYVVKQINNLEADVIGLQEADESLVKEFESDDRWQARWRKKTLETQPDGCLTLVRRGLEINDYKSFAYDDNSGHVFQITQIGRLAVVNTHIRWSHPSKPDHAGVAQARQLLDVIGATVGREPVVILADINDRPGGPVRALIEEAGFYNVGGNEPTAFVNQRLAAIDVLAVRGVGRHSIIESKWGSLESIPNKLCPSDHIPIIADIEE